MIFFSQALCTNFLYRQSYYYNNNCFDFKIMFVTNVIGSISFYEGLKIPAKGQTKYEI